VEIIPGQAERGSGIGLRLFGFIPESRSPVSPLLKQLTKALPERAAHLGYEKHDPVSHKQWQLAQWRDDEDVERGIFGKCRWRRRGIATAATNRRSSVRGRRASPVSTTRSFRYRGGHERASDSDTRKRPLVEVSPALICNVTEEMVEEVKIWQNRPLDTWRNLLKQKLRVELNKR
jgi:hypothetical protein